MKHAFVAGASGGIGFALVQELVKRGVHVTAFARGEEKLRHLYQEMKNVTIKVGDILNQKDLIEAVEGADTLFHAIGFPYEKWANTHLPCMKKMIEAAKRNEARIVLADNIYAYGIQGDRPVDELAKKIPHTKKGKLRLEMEKTLLLSSVPALIAHLPDLYGPNAENTLLHETLNGAINKKKANYIGCPKKKREFLYTRDAAEAVVRLAEDHTCFNQNWNIASKPINGHALLQLISKQTNHSKGYRIVKRRMIRTLGLFSPFMREMVEMMYLTEQPVLLDGTKAANKLGKLPYTPFEEGIAETVSWMKSRAM
ncbi:SDR family NAD(P)-dependent oxidoreductase [Shouchella patagoniensis]|uniref:SDR family NAD(P)-dependent oxidoreductase n=1 Tax=Shouchella patagoniensis TaxID=228576 RepID=UPI000995073B|nr:SDR family NAD(P)-dependent oxidoreductase [Shouchella patagoniensis]